jgi:carboxylate-amine ligase
LLPVLVPIAESLGCAAELASLAEIVDRGASYQRQLRVAAAHGGSLKAVVSSLVRELRESQPN